MAFPNYPYTDFHRLNGDYLLEQVNKAAADAATAQANAEAAIGRAEEAGASALTAVRYEAQDLTAAQKAQARTNIGAAAADQIPDVSDVVRTSAQTLTPTQQGQARTNIGAASRGDVADVVRTSTQVLTDGQKAQARMNIGAVSAAQVPDVSDVVRTSAQTLTAAQQTQARTNIGATSRTDMGQKLDADNGTAENLTIVSPMTLEDPETGNSLFATVESSVDSGNTQLRIVLESMDNQTVQLRGVAAPTLDQDAATKAYVDNRGLPPATAADTGKVPAVQSDGTYALSALGEGIHTIQDLLDLTDTMSEEQRARFAANTDLERHPATHISATSAASLYPVNNTIYRYGTLTSLQIQAAPAGIQYIIKFISGSTPTVFTPPTDEILGLSDFVPEANTEYEINVWDNRAVIGSWAVISGE